MKEKNSTNLTEQKIVDKIRIQNRANTNINYTFL